MADDPEATSTNAAQKPDEGDDTPVMPAEGDGDSSKPSDGEDDLEKWKRHARHYEAEAKRNAEAAKRLQEIEDAKKSETEKLTEAQQAAEARAAKAEHELARSRVALRKGLTEAMAKRLVGETEEELEADADELLAALKPDDEGGDTSLRRRPHERLRAGARPDAEPEKSAKEVVAAIPRQPF